MDVHDAAPTVGDGPDLRRLAHTDTAPEVGSATVQRLPSEAADSSPVRTGTAGQGSGDGAFADPPRRLGLGAPLPSSGELPVQRTAGPPRAASPARKPGLGAPLPTTLPSPVQRAATPEPGAHDTGLSDAAAGGTGTTNAAGTEGGSRTAPLLGERAASPLPGALDLGMGDTAGTPRMPTPPAPTLPAAVQRSAAASGSASAAGGGTTEHGSSVAGLAAVQRAAAASSADIDGGGPSSMDTPGGRTALPSVPLLGERLGLGDLSASDGTADAGAVAPTGAHGSSGGSAGRDASRPGAGSGRVAGDAPGSLTAPLLGDRQDLVGPVGGEGPTGGGNLSASASGGSAVVQRAAAPADAGGGRSGLSGTKAGRPGRGSAEPAGKGRSLPSASPLSGTVDPGAGMASDADTPPPGGTSVLSAGLQAPTAPLLGDRHGLVAPSGGQGASAADSVPSVETSSLAPLLPPGGGSTSAGLAAVQRAAAPSDPRGGSSGADAGRPVRAADPPAGDSAGSLSASSLGERAGMVARAAGGGDLPVQRIPSSGADSAATSVGSSDAGLSAHTSSATSATSATSASVSTAPLLGERPGLPSSAVPGASGDRGGTATSSYASDPAAGSVPASAQGLGSGAHAFTSAPVMPVGAVAVQRAVSPTGATNAATSSGMPQLGHSADGSSEPRVGASSAVGFVQRAATPDAVAGLVGSRGLDLRAAPTPTAPALGHDGPSGSSGMDATPLAPAPVPVTWRAGSAPASTAGPASGSASVQRAVTSSASPRPEPLSDPASLAIAHGIGTREPDGSVRFADPVTTAPTGLPPVQRVFRRPEPETTVSHVQPAAVPPSPPADGARSAGAGGQPEPPAAQSFVAAATPAHPLPVGSPATPSAAAQPPPTTAASPESTDELVRRLVAPLSRLLRAELRLERERGGRRLDIRH
ncbi:hypothetical protein [Yinghuangia seranimata]|uniref:hypothetical protein n=1 Tax=Yinghuangia seranimata TaxID=408067 RepID=UPI00248B8352|nr:hypothetical protein [Yinghuangia seranimata]